MKERVVRERWTQREDLGSKCHPEAPVAVEMANEGTEETGQNHQPSGHLKCRIQTALGTGRGERQFGIRALWC